MIAVTTIRADVLKGLLLTAAKEDVRYYLVGIYFDTVRGALVTTDGHKMIAYKCDLPKEVKPFILSRETCLQALKMVSKKNNGLDVEIEAEGSCRRIQLRASTGALCMGPEVDGRFPDWTQIIPKNCTMQAAQFNGAYMDAMQSAFQLILDDGMKSIPAIMHNGDSAALVLAGGHTNVMGIIMPMRQGTKSDFQEWRKFAYQAFGLIDTPATIEAEAA